MVMPQQPPTNTPRTQSPDSGVQAKRGDELLTGVGHTVYEFQGNSPGRSAELGMSMGQPQRSNLSSGKGGVAIWIGVAVLLGAGALFWKINSGSASADAPSDKDAVAASSGQTPAEPVNSAPAKVAQDTTQSQGSSKAQQEAAAKAKAEAEAKKKAEQEAAAKKKAEQEAAAKKKAEQEAAAKKKAAQEAAAKKKKAASKPKPKKKSKPKKKKSGVKRIKPRKPSGLDGLPDPD